MDQKKKHFWNIKASVIVYNLLCNIPVCFFLTLASTIIAATTVGDGKLVIDFNTWNWMIFGINYGISLVLAMCIGCFVPLTSIGRWFTGLFHVSNVTYAGNMKYRLLATLIISCIYYSVITPTLTLFNYFVFHSADSLGQCLLLMGMNAPLMLLVGFVSSLISDLSAYKAAHTIDSEF